MEDARQEQEQGETENVIAKYSGVEMMGNEVEKESSDDSRETQGYALMILFHDGVNI
jgi:hypothetical protein